MKFSVQVKPNSRRNEVAPREDGSLLVFVDVPPVEGRANKKLIEVLARHFGKPKRSITIVSGVRGKHKIVEVL
ncbi:MAG TPA: hypothetical protein DCX46_08005 [Bacteroidetes bacterium]|nr:hypothetical protein [Bacteroidota bacterium]